VVLNLETGPVEAVAYPGVVVQPEGLQAGEGQQGQAGQEEGVGESAPCGWYSPRKGAC
jgi:hypothetical protein